jgi:hypothetical protein
MCNIFCLIIAGKCAQPDGVTIFESLEQAAALDHNRFPVRHCDKNAKVSDG